MIRLFAISALLLFAACHPISLERHDLTTAEKDAVKAKLGPQLRDPEATQWRWPKVSAKFLKQDRQGSYCGWFNAKNGFGGYVGFQMYQADLSHYPDGRLMVDVTPLPDEPARAAFFRGICTGDGQVLTDTVPAT